MHLVEEHGIDINGLDSVFKPVLIQVRVKGPYPV